MFDYNGGWSCNRNSSIILNNALKEYEPGTIKQVTERDSVTTAYQFVHGLLARGCSALSLLQNDRVKQKVTDDDKDYQHA